jgi:hypothetical protein
MAPSAAPQETAQTRQAQIEKLQDVIRKGQQGLSQDEVNMLKNQLQAQWHTEETICQRKRIGSRQRK